MTIYELRPDKLADEKKDLPRRAVEVAGIGAFYCPLPLGKFYCNALCKMLWGLGSDTPDEVSIESFYGSIHPQDRERTRAALDASIAHGDPYNIEYRTVSQIGEIRWIWVKGRVSVNETGSATRFDGVTIDITDRKCQAAENSALVEKERTQRMAAECANNSKDVFIAAVSHELRAPLTAMLAWVDLLSQGSDDHGFVQNGISVIRRNVLTQTRLVDDLLDNVRISKGKFSVERKAVNLTACLNGALQDIRPIADGMGIFVSDLIAEEVSVQGDGPRLRQVFGNLLCNALKHTEPAGRILPSLVVAGNTVRISVADTGAGIPSDRLEEIFQPFVQVDNSGTRDLGGLGLGLAIAKSIVAMHGGEIAAHSSGLGHGSTFTVVLPIAGGRSGADVCALEGDCASVLKGKTVVLVDDDADTLEALAITLQLENARVHGTRSAAEARQIVLRELPDIIVSDLTMPGESGYDLVRALRQQGIGIPAIALSGHVKKEDEQNAIDAGFDAYLSKPVELGRLLEIIVKLARPL